MFCILGVMLALSTFMTLATDGNWLASTWATVTINEKGQAEHTCRRVVEVMHKICEESTGAPKNDSPKTTEPQGVPGKHAILCSYIPDY
jgi:hypothetical protein